MNWARQRQLAYALVVLGVILAVLLYIYSVHIYEAPSCSDTIQNQGEEGRDCGGPCSLLCAAPHTEVLWARVVKVSDGVYHAVGKIQNSLLDARGTEVMYHFSVYDEKNLLIATRDGSLTLEPGEVRAVFEPALLTGKQIPQRAFLEVEDSGTWTHSTSSPNRSISILSQGAFDEAKRSLDVVVENTTTRQVKNVVVTALLFDSQDIIINASQTRIQMVGPREVRTLTFTWPEVLDRTVSRVDVEVHTLQ